MMLRRIMYLSIKDMSTMANDVIIVTASLTRDMTGKEDSHRGPAIRALCKITDVRIELQRKNFLLLNLFRQR